MPDRKKHLYYSHTASTIRFVTYAAEELVGYTNYGGSIYYAGKMAANKEDIRLVINNDMVAYTKDSSNSIFGTCMPSGINAWAGDFVNVTWTLLHQYHRENNRVYR